MDGPDHRTPPTVLLGVESANPPADATTVLPGPGSSIGPYRITDQLGEGGMGVVYRAEDSLLNRTVALKILPPHLFRSPEYLERFRIEAQAQARLQSPNVVTLYTMVEDRAGLVLVMEYVEGETLEQRIAERGALPAEEALRIFEQVLLGVEQAHRLGIVHRDLKPGNVFLTRGGPVKIMDFGVAKLTDRKEFTTAGSRIGTLLYISPEQVEGLEADARSDIYTLGVSLYQALTGRLPFTHETEFALMRAHLEEPPPPPSTVQPDIPAEVEAVVLRAMAKDPAKRFGSATEFRKAVLGCLRKLRLRPLQPGAAPVAPQAKSPIVETLKAMTRRIATRRSLFGRLGVEIALVIAIVLLALFLGLYPRSKPDAEPSSADASARDTTTTPKRSSPAPERAASSKPRPSAPTSPAVAPPAKPPDKYEDLRRAWGGG